MDNIIIEGFIGSGKGAAGRAVGKAMDLEVVDLDRKVSDRLKMSVADIYEKFGEVYFRAMETLVLKEMSEDKEAKRRVIVLGSGVAMMPQNEKYLKELGHVYYLRLTKETLRKRIRERSRAHRWISSDSWDEQVAAIFKERGPAYMKTADVVVDADGLRPEEIALLIKSYETGQTPIPEKK